MWTITNELADRARLVGKGMKDAQEQFKELYRACCVECGGEEWKLGDYEGIFSDVQDELKKIMVDEGYISSNTYHSYCAATRKCLVFDVPWSFTRKCTKIKDLARLKEIVATFKDDADEKTKLDRAWSQLCTEKQTDARKEKVKNGMAQSTEKSPISLPLPTDGETAEMYLTKLFQNFKNYCDGSKVQPHLSDPFLQAMLTAAKGGLDFHRKKTLKPVALYLFP